jgi:hypothetical protein
LDGSTGDLVALVLLVARLGGCASAGLSLFALDRGFLAGGGLTCVGSAGALAGGVSMSMAGCALLDLVARPVVAGLVSVTLSVAILESGVALAFPGGFARARFTGFKIAE